jgi:hypothetical protein
LFLLKERREEEERDRMEGRKDGRKEGEGGGGGREIRKGRREAKEGE